MRTKVKMAFSSALAGLLSIAAIAMAAVGESKTNQVTFSYEPPENPAHQAVYEDLRDRRVLERLQELLSPFPIASDREIHNGWV